MAFSICWIALEWYGLPILAARELSPNASTSVFFSNDHPEAVLSLWFTALVFWSLGLADDYWQLAARYRLVAQILVIGLLIGFIWPELFQKLQTRLLQQSAASPVELLPLWLIREYMSDSLVWIGAPMLLCLGLVFAVNAFNFMDGADGLAGFQAVFLLLAASIFGRQNALILLLAVLVLVFIYFNFPPARVFMGDAGSNLLGLILGCLYLEFFIQKPVVAALLPAVFIADVSVTLCRRIWRRQNFFRAHSEHAYQHLMRRIGHQKLAWVLISLDLLLLCAAWLINQMHFVAVQIGLLGIIYAALIGGALWLGAGTPRTQD
ncbi:MAG: hypothetical protein KDK39_08720 [Leptospiraceae bacterium]|nr:hypothetical protein [Leptospiraceae bacterium]